MATVIPSRFQPAPVKIDKQHWNVMLMGKLSSQFATQGKAKTFRKKLEGMLRYLCLNSIGADQVEFPAGLADWMAAAADGTNGFNPPLTLSS